MYGRDAAIVYPTPSTHSVDRDEVAGRRPRLHFILVDDKEKRTLSSMCDPTALLDLVPGEGLLKRPSMDYNEYTYCYGGGRGGWHFFPRCSTAVHGHRESARARRGTNVIFYRSRLDRRDSMHSLHDPQNRLEQSIVGEISLKSLRGLKCRQEFKASLHC